MSVPPDGALGCGGDISPHGNHPEVPTQRSISVEEVPLYYISEGFTISLLYYRR